MSKQVRVVEGAEERLEVSAPKDWAAGVPGVAHSMGPGLSRMGVSRGMRGLLAMNQKDGFDCMSCAWPDPRHRKTFEFCENGAKALTWEATPVLVSESFWAEHPIDDLLTRTDYWLGMQGRLAEPVYKSATSDHYEPISWGEAFKIVGEALKGLKSPDEATFYTSGRTANETAFAWQLFAREFGTNNLPDCSNMCHESTGAAMGEVIGVGKSTIHYDDFEKSELIIIMGQNPGTNHPRMLTALEDAKRNGATIVAVNPLPEAGLRRYKNPQRPRGIIGHGTDVADQFLQIRLAGDQALMQAVARRVLDAEDAHPGTVLDHAFIDRYCQGFDEYRKFIAGLDDNAVRRATGLTDAEIDELADRYIASNRTIITWAMGLTQHKNSVPAIREIINLLLLKGNIGKPGAGASPIRGHSNVQGDRTMGIWEQMPKSFLDNIQKEFHFDPPRKVGVDAVNAIRSLRDGKTKVWIAMGGNLVAAISDTVVAEKAMQNAELTVQVSTKLNRSHAVVGKAAMILPVLGRSEIDEQASGPQMVTIEDTIAAVHGSTGKLKPVAPNLLSEISVISRIARATLGDGGPVDWASFERDYDVIRDHISRVVPGFENYNTRSRQLDGFDLPHGPRDSRTFPTKTGKAMFSVNELEVVEVPEGRLLLQTMRSHDQFNTTIYSNNDRYRGVKNGRKVVFVSPEDLATLGISDGSYVDVHSEWEDGVDRVIKQFRVISYPTAKGCVAAYFPEANPLVALDNQVIGSGTPVSKSVVVRLEPTTAPAEAVAA